MGKQIIDIQKITMSEYKFKINGKDYTVCINSIENGIAKVNVNGADYSVEIEAGAEGLASSDASHTFGPTTAQGAAVPPLSMPRVAASSEASPSAPATSGNAASTGSAAGRTVTSPLPGVIIDVCVNQGDAVKKGQKIAVIEAMKMENDILAECDGSVSAIFVKKGDSVLEGADIAKIA